MRSVLRLKILIITIIILGLFFVINTYAQDDTNVPGLTEDIFPEVYPEISSVSVQEKTLFVDFDITNANAGKVDNISYVIKIIRPELRLTDISIFEYKPSDVLLNFSASGSENSKKSIKERFDFEDVGLSGLYVIKVEILNVNGEMLAWDEFEFPFSDSVSSYIFFAQDFDLIVSYGGKDYAPQMGVNIDTNSILKFKVFLDPKEISPDLYVFPAFKIYKQNVFNGDVVTKILASQGVLPISGEEINFEIKPGIDLAGVYEGLLYFENSSGQRISESIPIRFVVKGASARILNITTDKNFYFKDDTAKVSIDFVTSADAISADIFLDEEGQLNPQNYLSDSMIKKLSFKLTISDKIGKLCGETTKSYDQPAPPGQKFSEDIEIGISADCDSPIVKLEIFDADKLLDSLNTVLVSTDTDKNLANKNLSIFDKLFTKNNSLIITIFGLVLAGISIFVLLYFFVFRKRTKLTNEFKK